MSKKETRRIEVDYIARVEGEGALSVTIEGEQITDVKLKIFEPPRFFEALLRGRDFREAPDVTARICGICPVAYQMSAVLAMEDLLAVQLDAQVADLRRLLYCAEWIESHTLHIYMLHAPDFLGCADVVEMAKIERGSVERGLRLKRAGNQLLSLIGGREIHPINVRVGGFYRLPERKQLQNLVDELKWARDAAAETLRWVAQFDFPDFQKPQTVLALVHPERYAIESGELRSNRGHEFSAHDFDSYVQEFQVPHSSALHSRLRDEEDYLVGPVARYHLNHDKLPSWIQQLASECKVDAGELNPFKSILARSIEVIFACDEALRIIEAYQPTAEAATEVEPRAGQGFACTEAPRGTLFHRYRLDAKGIIEDASIVPPTSQNQRTIERDLAQHLAGSAHLSDEELARKSERFIRNYDPCISCATHFLKIRCTRR